ncbi:MAG: hypothetical protein ACRDP1_06505 [Nocardioidaceae bacterium]
MTMRRFGWLVGSLVFGAAVELMKARGSWASDVRGELGNLSTPWLLLGFLSSLGTPTIRAGAVRGLVATLAALVAFYATETLLFVPQLGNHGGLLGDFAWVFRAGLLWLVFGLVAGPVMGVIGAYVGNRHRYWTVPICGLLLIGEPLVLSIVGNRRIPLPSSSLNWSFQWTNVAVAELVVGAMVIGGFLAWRVGIVPARRP